MRVSEERVVMAAGAIAALFIGVTMLTRDYAMFPGICMVAGSGILWWARKLY